MLIKTYKGDSQTSIPYNTTILAIPGLSLRLKHIITQAFANRGSIIRDDNVAFNPLTKQWPILDLQGENSYFEVSLDSVEGLRKILEFALAAVSNQEPTQSGEDRTSSIVMVKITNSNLPVAVKGTIDTIVVNDVPGVPNNTLLSDLLNVWEGLVNTFFKVEPSSMEFDCEGTAKDGQNTITVTTGSDNLNWEINYKQN